MSQLKIVLLCILTLEMAACKPSNHEVTPAPTPTPISLSNYCLYHRLQPELTRQDTLTQCEIYLNQPYAGNASIMAFNAVGSEIAFPYLRFTFKNFNGPGIYTITDTGNCNAYYYYDLSRSVGGISGALFVTDSAPYRGSFTVTYADSNVISGEFKCKP